MATIALAGITLGLIASFHCVGMCGPLVMALPVGHLSRWRQVIAVMLYNTGRVFTYTLLGLLLGLAGRRLYLAGWQQWLSVCLGLLLLLPALYILVGKRNLQPKWLSGLQWRLQLLMARFIGSQQPLAHLGLGALNGLLPCGMVYLATAGTLGMQQVGDSVLFMFFFGAGTWPAMFAIGLFGLRIKMSFRQQIKRGMPYLLAFFAVLFILRGLNLGIPFISPVLPQAPGQVVSCHE